MHICAIEKSEKLITLLINVLYWNILKICKGPFQDQERIFLFLGKTGSKILHVYLTRTACSIKLTIPHNVCMYLIFVCIVNISVVYGRIIKIYKVLFYGYLQIRKSQELFFDVKGSKLCKIWKTFSSNVLKDSYKIKREYLQARQVTNYFMLHVFFCWSYSTRI